MDLAAQGDNREASSMQEAQGDNNIQPQAAQENSQDNTRPQGNNRMQIVWSKNRPDPRVMTDEQRAAFKGYDKQLKAARLKARLSQEDAGKLVGGCNWKEWETGNAIPLPAVREQIEKYFGVPEPEAKPMESAPEEPKKRKRKRPEQASTMLDYVAILATDAGMHYGAYVAQVGDEAIREGWQAVLKSRRRV